MWDRRKTWISGNGPRLSRRTAAVPVKALARMRMGSAARLILVGALLAAAGGLWWRWVERRTEDEFVGVSSEPVRWAYQSEQQRLRSICLGTHGVQDALQGHPRDFCIQFLQELKAHFKCNGLDWEVEARRARKELMVQEEHSGS